MCVCVCGSLVACANTHELLHARLLVFCPVVRQHHFMTATPAALTSAALQVSGGDHRCDQSEQNQHAASPYMGEVDRLLQGMCLFSS
jgi:hypothetical protein